MLKRNRCGRPPRGDSISSQEEGRQRPRRDGDADRSPGRRVLHGQDVALAVRRASALRTVLRVHENSSAKAFSEGNRLRNLYSPVQSCAQDLEDDIVLPDRPLIKLSLSVVISNLNGPRETAYGIRLRRRVYRKPEPILSGGGRATNDELRKRHCRTVKEKRVNFLTLNKAEKHVGKDEAHRNVQERLSRCVTAFAKRETPLKRMCLSSSLAARRCLLSVTWRWLLRHRIGSMSQSN